MNVMRGREVCHDGVPCVDVMWRVYYNYTNTCCCYWLGGRDLFLRCFLFVFHTVDI